MFICTYMCVYIYIYIRAGVVDQELGVFRMVGKDGIASGVRKGGIQQRGV